jgi:hypothetical protein
MDDILLGIQHITDWRGYDHMLYLLALAAWADWKGLGRLVVLATAFTIGHSVTLFLAGMDWVRPNGAWIEFLIPVSIALTAIFNLRREAGKGGGYRPSRWLYAITIAFGLIHGLGFSSFFRITRDEGAGIVMPLLRFNLGVEIGQLAFLLAFVAIASLLRALGVTQREQQVFVCAGSLAIALLLAMERLP